MQGKDSRRRSGWGAATSLVAVLAALALPVGAGANVPFQDINSPGPLSNIYVGNDLSCQVKLTQDEVFSYYPPATRPGDCGTFLQIDGTPGNPVFAPDFEAHDGTAASNADWLPWTPVSQSAVTGSGTPSSPFSVTTRVAAGVTNVFVRETYTYVIGQRSYGVRIEVINNNPTPRTVRLYHAVDCYLAGSDFGYGFVNASTGGVFCTETPNNSPPGRVLGFTPGSPANHIESFFGTVWSETDGTDYPNTSEPDVFQDNGVGLQFNLTVPGGGSNEISAVELTGTVDSGDALETAITKAPKKKVRAKKKKKRVSWQFVATLGGVPVPNATFQCTVDSKPSVPCTSPFTTKLKKGKHTFSVTASANGETDPSAAVSSVKVKRKKKK
jgi:hypothetical protein